MIITLIMVITLQNVRRMNEVVLPTWLTSHVVNGEQLKFSSFNVLNIEDDILYKLASKTESKDTNKHKSQSQKGTITFLLFPFHNNFINSLIRMSHVILMHELFTWENV